MFKLSVAASDAIMLWCFMLGPRDYHGKRVNPPYRSSNQGNPSKLFLDIVPSSSEDVTRAMRGGRSDFTRLPGKNGGNIILYVLVSFQTRDLFCTLIRLFVWPGFRLIFLLSGIFIILPFIGF